MERERVMCAWGKVRVKSVNNSITGIGTMGHSRRNLVSIVHTLLWNKYVFSLSLSGL